MDPFQKIFMEGLASRAALYEKHDEGFRRMTEQGPTQSMIQDNSLPEKLRSLDLINKKIDNLKLENYFREKVGARGNIVFRPEALKVDLQKLVDNLVRVWSDANGDSMRAQYREPMTTLINKFLKKIGELMKQGDKFLKTQRVDYDNLRGVLRRNSEELRERIERKRRQAQQIRDEIYNHEFRIHRAQQLLEEAQRDNNGPEIARILAFIETENGNIARKNQELINVEEEYDARRNQMEKIVTRAQTNRFVDFTEKVRYNFENLKSELNTNILPDLQSLLTNVENYKKASIQAQQFASGQLKFDER